MVMVYRWRRHYIHVQDTPEVRAPYASLVDNSNDMAITCKLP